MQFLYPAFLVALAAILIPIIIHLFNFRKYQVIFFSNVKFLKEIKEQTQSTSRLKHLLILLARILAIAALVFAFAQPFIPSANKVIKGTKGVSIYADNSYSMQALAKAGTLLDQAKNNAGEIANAYKISDKFQFLTSDFEGRHQHLVNKDQYIEYADALTVSPIRRQLHEVMLRQKDVFTNTKVATKSAYIMSDFQKNTIEPTKIKLDTSMQYTLVPLQAQLSDNVAIDSCWFSTPFRQMNITDQLLVHIRNYSARPVANSIVKLYVDDKQKVVQNFSIGAKKDTIVALSFSTNTGGWHTAQVTINDHPITFDDTYYFSYQVANQIPVLAVHGSNPREYLDVLYGKDSSFIYQATTEGQINYNELTTKRLVVLNGIKSISSGLGEELQKFTKAGGSILVFPSSGMDISSYNSFLGAMGIGGYGENVAFKGKVTKLNSQSMIYDDVFERTPDGNIDLPSIQNYYPISKNSRTKEVPLMTLSNGGSFLSSFDAEKGKVHVCAASLLPSASNFANHAMFVPTLYKIALYSGGYLPLYQTIGTDNAIEISTEFTKNAEDVFRLQSLDKKLELIPEHSLQNGKMYLFVHNEIKKAGTYALLNNGNILQYVSFNYPPLESDLETYTAEELQQLFPKEKYPNLHIADLSKKDITQLVKDLDEGMKLWKWFLIAALVFLAIEIALARLWKES